MSKTHCPGCGAPFQSDKPGEPGFLPSEAKDRENPICRRCYRLRHYGQLESFGRSTERISGTVQKVGHELDLAVLVVDLFDLEGSLNQDWRKLINVPVVLALNKVDLLPKRTPVAEVIEAVKQISRERIPELQWKEIVAVSAAKGSGLPLLKEQIIYRRGRNHRIGFFGVTNTGKSSLLSRFLPPNQPRPTISNRPGTTQGVTSWYIPEDDLTFIDTPGWTPGNRLMDKLCPDCSGRLVVKSEVVSKYLDLGSKAAVLMGSFALLENIGQAPATVVAYTSESVRIHPTNIEKAHSLLENPPDWLAVPCQKCGEISAWQCRDFDVSAGSDLYISGLGWFAVRKADAHLRLRFPEGVETGLRRPTLFGGKKSI